MEEYIYTGHGQQIYIRNGLHDIAILVALLSSVHSASLNISIFNKLFTTQ